MIEYLGLGVSLLSVIVASGICYYQIKKNRQLALLNETIKRMETMALIAADSLQNPHLSYEVYFLHRQIAKASLEEFLGIDNHAKRCVAEISPKLQSHVVSKLSMRCIRFVHNHQEKMNILDDYKQWVEYCELHSNIESRHDYNQQQSSQVQGDIYIKLADIIQKLIAIK